LAGGGVHERGDIAAHLVVGFGVPDGPREAGLRLATVRVARVAASSLSADRTVAAVSSRSSTAPMIPMSGSRTSRWVLTVFGARPARPSASQSLIACATV